MRVKKHILPFLLILTLTAGVTLANYLWLAVNSKPPLDDEAIHLISAVKYLDILKHPSLDMVGRLLHVDILYPPLFPFVAALIAAVSGHVNTVAFVMTNAIFLAVTLFCMYFIGLKMKNKWSGILAGSLLMIYPLFFNLSRMFMIEIPLVCMVTLCITLLLYARNFKTRYTCLWAGVIFGLGLLTKQTFPLFIVGPAAFFFIEGFSGFKPKEENKIFNFVLFIIIGIGVALPWYATDFQIKYAGALTSISDASLVPYKLSVFSLTSFGYYLAMLVKEQLMESLALFFILALMFFLHHKANVRLFIIWFVVPYVLLSFFPNKFCYYTLPYLPAVAFLTIGGLSMIETRFIRILVFAFLFYVGIHQYIIFSYFSLGKLSPVAEGITYSPRLDDLMASKLVNRIIAETRGQSITVGIQHFDGNEAARKGVVMGEAGILLNKHMLQYAFDLKGLLAEVIDLRGRERRHDGMFPEFIVYPCLLANDDNHSLSTEKYRLIDVFELWDLSKVYLYRFVGVSSVEVNASINKDPYAAPRLPNEFDAEVLRRMSLALPPGNIIRRGLEALKK